jgi:hypothetical protein
VVFFEGFSIIFPFSSKMLIGISAQGSDDSAQNKEGLVDVHRLLEQSQTQVSNMFCDV